MPGLHLLAACAACGRQYDAAHQPGPAIMGAAPGATPVAGSGRRAALGPGDTFRCSCGGEVTVPSVRPSDAAVVTCAACGAPRQGGAEGAAAAACAYCEADFTLRERDLDAVCPRCAARVSRRGRFCHHCSLPLTAPRHATPSEHACPACAAGAPSEPRPPEPLPPEPRPAEPRLTGPRPAEPRPTPRLVSRRAGGSDDLHLFQCPRCAGLWLDRAVFEVLLERTRQGRGGLGTGSPAGAPAEVGAGMAGPATGAGTRAGAGAGDGTGPGTGAAGGAPSAGFAYRPCAVCGKLMNRRNYARRSGVILDVCREHGLWFDADELHRVLAWVRRGGATESELPVLPPDPRRPAGPLFDDSLGGGSPFGGRGFGGGGLGGDLLTDVLAALGGALLRRLP